MATNGTLSERNALVLYGTETGTSQDLAEELGRLLERLHFSTDIRELDGCAAGNLSRFTLSVFVLATTGQGDFPSNARKFWTSLLRKKLTPTFLDGIQFALVGLGDSSYPKFNWAARKLGKRLVQLGAHELIDPCEADEQGDEGTDGTFLAWSERFRSMLMSSFPLPNGQPAIPDDVRLPRKWQLVTYTNDSGQDSNISRPETKATSTLLDLDTRPILGSFSSKLVSNKRMTPLDHWQDVRFLQLHTSDHIEYFPGDSLSILPKNSHTDVGVLIDLMGWTHVADLVLKFEYASRITESRNEATPIPSLGGKRGFTLRDLLMDYLDIKAIPRRSFFAVIATYTNNEMHKDRLLEFTNPEYLDEFYDYATRPRRSILEILQEFDSVKLPFQEAANIFPIMRPRQFSIASGGRLKHSGGGTTFELLVAIVKYRTVIRRIREGVCSRYIASLETGSILNVVLKTEGRFHNKATDTCANHVLIGPGTGVAPLRALIHEKNSMEFARQVPNSTILFFGSRGSSADYFFRDEWKELAGPETVDEFGTGLHVITAFSRDQKAKIYVQDRIKENAKMIRRMLVDCNATVIVSGSSGQMPKAVRQALVDVLAQKTASAGNAVFTKEEAESFLAHMEKKGCYKQETW